MLTARENQISQFFQLKLLGTNYRTELLASLTSFMTIAPILVINAHLLGNAVYLDQPGDLFGQILFAIAFVSAIASIASGLLANYPIILTPGTGTIALFTFSVVLGMGMNWRLAFMAAFIEGILFTALFISPFRHLLNDVIPHSLKHSMVVGIGLFLSYIALSGNVAAPTFGAGIIVANTATTTSLGSLKEPATLIAISGILLTTLLTVRRIKGALLIGILSSTLLGWLWDVAPLPQGLFTLPQLPVDLIGQSIAGMQYLNKAQLGDFIAAVFLLLFVSLSDTINSFNVLGHQLNRIPSDSESRHFYLAFLANSLGAVFGACIGCVPVLPHVASASGILEGGRSGLVAIIVANFFLLSVLFSPLFAAIPAFATASVLIIVGAMMMSSAQYIDWSNVSESIPAFLVISVMPLTFSVADGMAAGFLAHAVVKVAQRNWQEMRSSLVLAVIATAYFLFTT